MTHWLSISELIGLPGLPTSAFRLREKLRQLGVPSRPRSGSKGGGGEEFDVRHLPQATQRAITARDVAAAPQVPVPLARAALVTTAPRMPSKAEAACADARVQVVRHLHKLAEVDGLGMTRATQLLADELANARAPADIMSAANAANLRPRRGADGSISLSVTTLYRWVGAYRDGGWTALLPTPAPASATIAEDVAMVLKAFASAQGAARNLTHCAQAVTDQLERPFDEWRNLYDRARRALPKLDKTRLIKARHTGAERAAKLPFKRRDTSTIRPLDVAVIDGHSFKSKVRHPEHGAPFAPEVTVVMDAASRKITGWSTSLSENTIAVGDALRRAVASHGVMAICYSDNGSGEKAKVLDCPVAGLFARLGTEHRTGIPGHPQGHGLIERSWQTTMIRAARQFGSYQGGDVDERTLRNVTLELAREQRAVKRAGTTGEVVRLSNKVPSWQQFVQSVQAAVEHYNTRHRHRSLPKHTDGPNAGLHMTPAEAFEALLVRDDQVMLDAPNLRHLFMPAVLRTAQRGEVRWLNTTYFNADLMAVDGEQVRLHYDLFDASSVWIWTVQGQFVCQAEARANAMGFFPTPVIERAREKRVLGMVKRREAQIDLARRELTPTLPEPSTDVITAQDMQALAPEPVPVSVPAGTRPLTFDSAAERFEFLMQHRSAWLEGDADWITAYAASDDYRDLAAYFESRGLAWSAADDAAFKHAG